jgi:hypothetical protein
VARAWHFRPERKFHVTRACMNKRRIGKLVVLLATFADVRAARVLV